MSRVIGRLRVALRQWCQPAAFRIQPPRWDDEQQILLAQLLRELPAPATEPAASRWLAEEKALAGAATSFWRARERLGQDGSEGSPGSRQASRHLETSQDRLAEAGLLIQDHTGSRFHPGLSLEVLAFVDDATLGEPTVVQTVKPCVYLNDHRIQMAQVVVGQPPRTATETDSPA